MARVMAVRGVMLSRVKVNLLSITACLLMLAAPSFSWITANIFDALSQSNLWDIAGRRVNMSLPPHLPTASLYSALLLVLGGLIGLRSAALGVVLGSVGILIFLVYGHSVFGSSGPIVVTVNPGIGFLMSLMGVVIGALSMTMTRVPIHEFVQRLRTRPTVLQLGLVFASLGLALDGWNHRAVGHFDAFLGDPPWDRAMHLGLIATLLLIVIAVPLRKGLHLEAATRMLAAVCFVFLIGDVCFHFISGDLPELIGDGSLEIALHGLTYYGIALLFIASFLLNAAGDEPRALPVPV